MCAHVHHSAGGKTSCGQAFVDPANYPPRKGGETEASLIPYLLKQRVEGITEAGVFGISESSAAVSLGIFHSRTWLQTLKSHRSGRWSWAVRIWCSACKFSNGDLQTSLFKWTCLLDGVFQIFYTCCTWCHTRLMPSIDLLGIGVFNFQMSCLGGPLCFCR